MPKKYSSLEELNSHFESKGSKILAVIGKDGEELPLTEVPSTKTKVKWQCANNKSHVTIGNLGGISVGDRERYVCRSCGISKGRGGGFDVFVGMIEAVGWKVLSSSAEYKNSKSSMEVVCNNNHVIKTTQNRFANDHGCKKCYTQSQRKHTISDVSEEFKTKGFKLLATTYKNNAELMDYICKCGRTRKITYNNFRANIDGCNECTRRWTYAEVEDFFEDNGCKLLCEGTKPEFILNSTRVSYLCFCKSSYQSSWRLFKNGARCAECTKSSIRETCMAIYGVDNPSKNEAVKQKIKDTMLERYGVEYAMQIKEFSDTAKETNIKNHGGKHNLTLPGVREEAAEAYEKKYGAKFGKVPEHIEKGKRMTRERIGVDYPFQSKEIHVKIKKNNLEKYGKEVYIVSETGKKQMKEKYGSEYYVTSEQSKEQTKEKYGSEYYITSEHFTESMIRKFGVPYAIQNPEILSKAMLTAYSSKDYITPSGKQWKIQGYEHYALDLIFSQGIEEDDIVVSFDNVPTIPYTFQNTQKVYFPDIFIKSLNLIIEVKSSYTFLRERPKNIAKFQATAKLYNFELWIFNQKGERIEQRPFTSAILEFT